MRNRVRDITRRATGTTQTEKGFMSTTSDVEIAEGFGGCTGSDMPIVMKINTGGKARGVNLSAYDRNASTPQKERLLARNTKYKTGRIYGNNGQIYVDVDLL